MNYNLCDEFIKYKRYLGYKYKTDEIVINGIKRFLFENKIEEITKNVIEKYVSINLNLKPNTIVRNINVFREFCKYLQFQNIKCYQIPKKLYKIKPHQYIPYIFSEKEIKDILFNIEKVVNNKPYSYIREQTIPLIIRILYQTGMRISEVLNLKIEDYNYNDDYLLVKNSKNNSERRIYLSKTLNDKLLIYHYKFHKNNSNDYFFKLKNSKINVNTIEHYFYETLKLSNIKRIENNIVLHNLRHTFIVKNIEKAFKDNKDFNIYLPYLQTYVGHKSIKSLEYYFHLTLTILSDITPFINDKLNNLIPNIIENYE